MVEGYRIWLYRISTSYGTQPIIKFDRLTTVAAKLQGPHVLELEYSPYQQDCQFPKTQEVVFACG